MTVGRSPRDDRKPRSSTAYRSNASPDSSSGPSPNTSPSRSARANEAVTAPTSTLNHPPRPPLDYSSPAFSSDSDNNNDQGVSRRAHSARGSVVTRATSAATGGINTATTSRSTGVAASSSTTTDYWKDDLSNLLTPQTVVEQAQVQRRKRNREAARRSRQKQKERERELVERQTQLSERLKFLEQELVEWRTMNANAPKRAPNTPAVGGPVDSQPPPSPQPATLPPLEQQQPPPPPPPLKLIDPGHVLASEDSELAGNINHVYDLTMETLQIIGQLQLQLDEITKELNDMIGSSS
ncbi:hypothetical protein GGH91_003324 [Coemansia sp. RSA 2671]|uniref:Uncharacterized protein n=1 Tax=Coemansia linderi TaxID=2663919 RepID=A0ACC1K7B1_9FUNG|nr:hypothetical protein LPJ60_004609 [Coemansia sp. RSA 2675]KAJ2343035.1 hypothetical protein GGH91_003324 [Coemansia sp. RSA 2671]KAJ2774935.1 hypothetical protein GGI18_004522 [Coemansia linderi]